MTTRRKYWLHISSTNQATSQVNTASSPQTARNFGLAEGQLYVVRGRLVRPQVFEMCAHFCLRIAGHGHDGRVDAHHAVPRHRAGSEPRSEEPYWRLDDAVADRVVDGQRDARRGGVANRLDVEVKGSSLFRVGGLVDLLPFCD